VLKLAVNVLYGAIASRFFPISNTVVANNITARSPARCLDAGEGPPAAPDDHRRWLLHPGRRPLHQGQETRAGDAVFLEDWRYLAPLAGWTGTFPDRATMDAMATEHVRAFWAPYGLERLFQIEHKTQAKENPNIRIAVAAWWNKGDYAFLFPDGEIRPAVRGKPKKPKPGEKPPPQMVLLNAILAGGDEFPTDLEYRRKGILKIGRFRQVQSSGGYEHLKGLRPGENFEDPPTVARFNNTHMPMDTLADYKRRQDRNRRRVARGQPARWFERFGPLGIRQVHRAMRRDALK
jgi:hypothetical protein